MSKKHFIALADMLRECHPLNLSKGTIPEPDGYDQYTSVCMHGARVEQWERMRDRLADFCKAQNSNFKRERWLDYIAGKCGKNGGTI